MADETPEVDPLTVLEVVSGSPSAEDIAAAKAVVAGMLREGGSVDGHAETDRWSAAARSGREPLEQGIQSWGEAAQ
ncbi:MAG: acyl-CoA carboxylase subunit epsilon [Microbacteriaceae bacterium]